MNPLERWGIPSALRGLRWYRAGALRTYDGMKPGETELMSWFWERHRIEYIAAAYNVRIGRGRPALPDIPEEFARDWQAATQLRIDALLWDSEQLTVVEVKPLADAEAFGQAVLYPKLLSRTYYIAVPVRAAVVCDDAHPDLVRYFVDAGIALYIRAPLSAIARQVAQPE